MKGHKQKTIIKECEVCGELMECFKNNKTRCFNCKMIDMRERNWSYYSKKKLEKKMGDLTKKK
jgi:methionyl-tRNA synthetase